MLERPLLAPGCWGVSPSFTPQQPLCATCQHKPSCWQVVQTTLTELSEQGSDVAKRHLAKLEKAVQRKPKLPIERTKENLERIKALPEAPKKLVYSILKSGLDVRASLRRKKNPFNTGPNKVFCDALLLGMTSLPQIRDYLLVNCGDMTDQSIRNSFSAIVTAFVVLNIVSADKVKRTIEVL